MNIPQRRTSELSNSLRRVFAPRQLRFVLISVSLIALLAALVMHYGVPAYYEFCSPTLSSMHTNCSEYTIVEYSIKTFARDLNEYVGLLTVLATIAIAFFTRQLRVSTEKLWSASERQLDHAKASTETQSKSSENQLAQTKASSERQLRAYVFAERIGIGTMAADFNGRVVQPSDMNTDPFLIKPDGTLFSMDELMGGSRSSATAFGMIVEIQIRNFGLTPAWRFKGWFGTGVLELDKQIAFPDPGFEVPVGVMPPSGINEFKFPLRFDRADAERILASKKAIYAFGRMEYWDAFDNRRTTTYRVECHGSNLNMLRFKYSLVGNDAT